MALKIVKGIPNRLPEGILFLPDNRAIRKAVREIIGLDGALIGPGTFTPYTFVQEFASEFGLPQKIADRERILLVREVLGSIDEFADGREIIGFVAKMASLLTALRRACIFDGDTLLKSVDGNSRRIGILAKLLDSYTRALFRKKMTDEPGLTNAVVERLRKGEKPKALAGIDRFNALCFDQIDREVASFFAALARFAELDFYIPLQEDNPYGEQRTDAANAPAKLLHNIADEFGIHVEVDKLDRGSCESDGLIKAVVGGGHRDTTIPESPYSDWPKLTVLDGKNPAEQAELVASVVKTLNLEYSIPLDDITIFAEGATESDILRALEDHGIPAEQTGGISHSETHFAELLRRFFALLRSQFGNEELFRLLSHRYIHQEGVRKYERTSRECGIIGGLPVEKSWLTPLVNSELDGSIEIAGIVEGISKIIPSAKWNGTISGSAFAEMLTGLFEHFEIKVAIANLIDDARGPIVAQTAEIEAFGHACELTDLFDSVGVDSLKNHCELFLHLLDLGEEERKGGAGVRILPTDAMSRECGRVAIVADMIQGTHPPAEPKYPIISVGEAEKLGINLPGFAFRRDYYLLNLLERAELVVLTRPLAEGDSPKPPAPIIISLERAMGKQFPAYRGEMKRKAECILSKPYSDRRRQINAGGLLSLRRDELGDRFEELADSPGLVAAARSLDIDLIKRAVPIDEYSGCLRSEFAPLLAGKFDAFTVTTLEGYAQCPFMFFARGVLQLNPPAEIDEGIPPSIAGRILHETLEEFWRKRIDSVFQPAMKPEERIKALTEDYGRISKVLRLGPQNIEDAIAETESIARRKIADFASKCPNPMAAGSLDYILPTALGKYLRNCADTEDPFIPIAVEQNLVGELDGVKVFGKADRIDASRRGFLRIVDYKWGNSPTASDILSSKALQLPLYSLFLDYPGETVGLTYVAGFKVMKPDSTHAIAIEDSDAGGKEIKRPEWDALHENVSATARGIIANIRAGFFPPQPRDGKCPPYCPFSGACGINHVESISGEVE